MTREYEAGEQKKTAQRKCWAARTIGYPSMRKLVSDVQITLNDFGDVSVKAFSSLAAAYARQVNDTDASVTKGTTELLRDVVFESDRVLRSMRQLFDVTASHEVHKLASAAEQLFLKVDADTLKLASRNAELISLSDSVPLSFREVLHELVFSAEKLCVTKAGTYSTESTTHNMENKRSQMLAEHKRLSKQIVSENLLLTTRLKRALDNYQQAQYALANSRKSSLARISMLRKRVAHELRRSYSEIQEQDRAIALRILDESQEDSALPIDCGLGFESTHAQSALNSGGLVASAADFLAFAQPLGASRFAEWHIVEKCILDGAELLKEKGRLAQKNDTLARISKRNTKELEAKLVQLSIDGMLDAAIKNEDVLKSVVDFLGHVVCGHVWL